MTATITFQLMNHDTKEGVELNPDEVAMELEEALEGLVVAEGVELVNVEVTANL